MHSRIFQLSTKKLPKEEWINDLSISEADMGYHGIDYCDETDDRKYDLKWLAEVLPKEVFRVKGGKIEIISDGSCLFDAYKKELLEKVQNMEFSEGTCTFLGLGPSEICYRARRIIDTDFLFLINDWDGLCRFNSLVRYAHYAMHDENAQKVLYVNGILDYHY